MDDSATAADLELPGFRFHPTEEELLDFYLKNMLLGKKLCNDIIGFLNIYHHDPWDLPGMAKIGEREWYFFVPRNSKHGSGGRPNRTTKKGFWKATGSDRKILSLSNSNPKKLIGLKKTLVFYTGRSPRGSKTDWVMNEYRLPLDIHTCPAPDAVVLCKIYRKATSLRVLEQRAAIDQKEEEMKGFNSITDAHGCGPSSPSLLDAVSICNQHDDMPTRGDHHVALKKEDEEELSSVVDKKIIDDDDDDDDDDHDSYKCRDNSTNNKTSTNNLRLPTTNLAQLQVPNKLSMDWTQDPFWTQLRSPWLDITFTPYYANVLNF